MLAAIRFFTVRCPFHVIAFGNRNKGPLFDLIGRAAAPKREQALPSVVQILSYGGYDSYENMQ